MAVTPPPLPKSANREDKGSLDKKIALLVVQFLVLSLASFVVWLMAYDRESTNQAAVSDISSEWGGPFALDGLYVENIHGDEYVTVDVLDASVEVETMTLHRRIYDAEVYNARINLAGTFSKGGIAQVFGDTVCVRLAADRNDIAKINPLMVGDKAYEWFISKNNFCALLPLEELPEEVTLKTSFDVRGSNSIAIYGSSTQTDVSMTGDASNPSFGGDLLPDKRKIKPHAFEAQWHIQRYGDDESIAEIRTEFLVGVNRYQKVERSVKYAFIIILLTYITVLLTEILLRRSIPLLNYFLIGAALLIFYTLLLSFSEHLSFGLSYLIAVVMTVGLISTYMYLMLKSGKVALTIAGLLALIYLVCYVLLNMAVYALLMGSLVLFFALAAMMYASLRIEKR